MQTYALFPPEEYCTSISRQGVNKDAIWKEQSCINMSIVLY